ncbi:MAG: ZIP family metal transporter, partial [Candidatus Micrarchaeota archaeon]
MLFEIIVATVLVSLISLVGILLLSLKKDTLDKLVFIILAFATGSLLAAAFFDLLPEALSGIQPGEVFPLTLAGIILMFVLERLVHWHHEHHDHAQHEKPVAYMVLLGDGVHNFFDGVAIAASFIASPALGVTTTIAIILHEIPQELSDYTLLLYAGFSPKKAAWTNLLSGFAALLGALAFYYSSSFVEDIQYFGLAFTAGIFIYISCTDILPEMHKEEKRSKSAMQ